MWAAVWAAQECETREKPSQTEANSKTSHREFGVSPEIVPAEQRKLSKFLLPEPSLSKFFWPNPCKMEVSSPATEDSAGAHLFLKDVTQPLSIMWDTLQSKVKTLASSNPNNLCGKTNIGTNLITNSCINTRSTQKAESKHSQNLEKNSSLGLQAGLHVQMDSQRQPGFFCQRTTFLTLPAALQTVWRFVWYLFLNTEFKVGREGGRCLWNP